MLELNRSPRRDAATASLLAALLVAFLPACGGGESTGSASASTSSSGTVALEESAAYPAYKSGLELAEAGDYDSAAHEFNRALQLDRFQIEIYYQLARSLNELGADQALGNVLDQALSLTSNHVGLLEISGDHASRGKKPQRAVKQFKKALALDEEQPGIHYKLGRALVYLSDAQAGARVIDHERLGEGIHHLERAAELDPKSSEYQLWLGMAYDRQNESPKALACYRKALELDPQNARASLQLGVGLLGQGDVAGARAAFEEAMALTPGDAELNYQYGMLLEQEGELEKAAAAYQKAIEGDRTRHEPYFRLCNVLTRLGRDEEGDSYCEASQYWSRLKDQLQYWHLEVKTKPDDPQALAKLGEVYYLRQEPFEALSWLGRALEIDAEHPLANTYAGSIFLEQGEVDKAAVFLEKALTGSPEDPLALEYMARLLLQKKELERAKEMIERLAKSAPDDPAAPLLLGSYYIETGDLDEARTSFKACIDLAPGTPQAVDALCRLGEIAFRTEDYAAAVETFQEVLRLSPQHPVAQQLLEVTEERLHEKDQG